MGKSYVNAALVYGVLAMACGVFYREFTKFMGFSGNTSLSLLHTHYFMLGMFFFLLLALLEKSFGFGAKKPVGKILAVYHVGLNITGAGFLIRGLVQVQEIALSSGADASLSGVAGIGHILLGVSLVLLLLRIKKSAA